jgi:hypothetical protein
MNKPELVERVARAIENARCTGREGPFGGYDYGYDTDFYGPEPEGGRYVVRDFRDPSSPTFGAWVHQTADRDEHEAAFKRLTEHHIATAAIEELGVERLVAALKGLERANEELAGQRSVRTYHSIVQDGAEALLLSLDNARHEAREALSSLSKGRG